MPVFYLLHELFNIFDVNEKESKTEHGKRNSKLFIMGIFIWVIIFVLAMNLKMGYFGPTRIWMDSLFYGLITLLLADIIVMMYTYKSYFGRSLMWETVDPNISEKKFNYDEKLEKYIRDPHREIVEAAKLEMTKDISSNAIRDAQLKREAKKTLAAERIRNATDT